jgi:Alpha/beta hydrolase family
MTDMITDHVKLPGRVTGVLERPGARLVYEVAGDGPAVVLIHGFGLDTRMWDPQIGPLAARFRVVRYDCRGFGASGPFDPGVPYTHAGDLVALLDHLGIENAVLAGRAGRPGRGPRPGPAGRVLAGPLTGEEGVLYAEIDTTRAQISRQQFDPVGHYSRSDVFRLIVDTSPRAVVTELNR